MRCISTIRLSITSMCALCRATGSRPRIRFPSGGSASIARGNKIAPTPGARGRGDRAVAAAFGGELIGLGRAHRLFALLRDLELLRCRSRPVGSRGPAGTPIAAPIQPAERPRSALDADAAGDDVATCCQTAELCLAAEPRETPPARAHCVSHRLPRCLGARRYPLELGGDRVS